MARIRLDDELVRQGLCRDRAEALRILMAGDVSAAGERLTSPGRLVREGLELHVRGHIPYVGRGGLKLAGALGELSLDPAGLTCLDVGCSTGGFTDCLLKRGASSVLAVDVGRAQFDWSLRNDPRVTLLERTNIVDVPALGYGDLDLAVCDVSFTSVMTVLPAVISLLAPDGRLLTLVKPQFEAEAAEVGSGGVVRDPAVWERVLARAAAAFDEAGLKPVGTCASPITGAKGNHEFFLLGTRGTPAAPLVREADIHELIERVRAR
ncbi:TlyA family RNA methyltransferase [Collinsella vaginalis]|uniref:TlyA family RNA methyltransferase n=1 Tax=Collinsella vaginalis TaxID=1870987 RepID=UPI000A270AB1|nr:TlyA family RNA methyltransferase [Collinsella vaginalis]